MHRNPVFKKEIVYALTDCTKNPVVRRAKTAPKADDARP